MPPSYAKTILSTAAIGLSRESYKKAMQDFRDRMGQPEIVVLPPRVFEEFLFPVDAAEVFELDAHRALRDAVRAARKMRKDALRDARRRRAAARKRDGR